MYLIARKEEPCFISKNRSTNIIRLAIICNQAYIVPPDYFNHYKPNRPFLCLWVYSFVNIMLMKG